MGRRTVLFYQFLPNSHQAPSPPLGHLWSAKGATGLGVWGYVERVGLQERHLYPRTNFKLHRAAALAKWRPYLWCPRPLRMLVATNVIAATQTIEGPAGVSST